MKKLLQHFTQMQFMVSGFISPELYTTQIPGATPTTHDKGDEEAKNNLFINDMIYMLDGPEQREAQAEASFDYVEQAHVTLSPQWHGELVGQAFFNAALANAIATLKTLDKVKKSLFYGKDNALNSFSGFNCENLPLNVTTYPDRGYSPLSRDEMVNLIHGIIGLATEAGELLELLSDTIDGKPFDRTNLEEEVGDGKWYMAILARVGGFVWGNDERKNIAKLRARFPDRFTEYDANNRDLETERAILETQHNLPLDETAARRFEAGGGGIAATKTEI